MTNFTPSAAKLLATETPCFGSETSSPNSTDSLLPRMPPAALMSAAACSTPFFICAPVAAFGLVIGPPTPNFTWAAADCASANAKPSATPSVAILFIFDSLKTSDSRQVRPYRNVMSTRLTAPAQRAVGLVDPGILRNHPAGARGLEPGKAEGHADQTVDCIVMDRNERAAE